MRDTHDSTDESAGRNVRGLLEVLARFRSGRAADGGTCSLRLAVAVACALAGARNFREAGDHALACQGVLARLGGIRIAVAPDTPPARPGSHLIQAIGADLLDDLTGGWLRAWRTRAGWTRR